MSKRLALPLLLVLGVAGFWLLRSLGESPTGQLDETPAQSEPETETPEENARRTPTPAPENAKPPVETPPPVDTWSPEEEAKRGAGEWHYVRLVAEDSGKPLTGVRVGVGTGASLMDAFRSLGLIQQGALVSLPTLFDVQSDDQGLVAWRSRFREDAAVAIDAGPYRGTALVRQGEGRRRATARIVKLPRIRLVRARALFTDGRPVVGIKLSFGNRINGRAFSTFGGMDATTDQKGYASVPLPPNLAKTSQAMKGLYREREIDFAVGIFARGVFGITPFVEVDLNAIPTEPCELRVPPCGQVEAVFSLDGDEGFVPDGMAYLVEGEGEVVPSVTAGLTADPISRRVVFPFVEAELDLTLHLRPASADLFRKASHNFTGPAAGDVTRIKLELKADAPSITGRLVDEVDGKPLAGLRFRSVHRCSAGLPFDRTRPPEVVTDSEGRFRIPLPEISAKILARARLVDAERYFEFSQGFSDTNDAPRYARVPIPLEPGESPLDVGDVSFGPLPVIVAGRCVDPDGAPLTPTDFTFNYSHNGENENGQVFRGGSLRTTMATTIIDPKDGSFEIRGVVTQREPGTVYHLESAPGPVKFGRIDFQLGQTDLLVNATANGSVRGIFRDCESVAGLPPLHRLRVLLIAPDAPRHQSRPGTTFLEPTGRFEIANFPAGRYELELRDHSQRPVFRSAPFLVEAGVTKDLGELDLDPPLERYEIVVRNEQGEPLTDRASVQVLQADSVGHTHFRGVPRSDEGYAFAFGRGPTMTFLVVHEGYARQAIDAPPGRTTVSLHPLLIADINVDLSSIPVPPNTAFNWNLRSDREGLRDQPTRKTSLADGSERYHVHEPGPYTLTLSFTHRPASGGWRHEKIEEPIARLQLVGPTPQRVDVKLTEAQLASIETAFARLTRGEDR